MKIAIISTLFGVDHGGSEELWIQLAQQACMQGHEVVALPYAKNKVPAKLQQLQSKGVEIRYRRHESVPSAFLPLMRFHIKRKLFRYNPYNLIDRLRPDLIYINQAGSVDVVIDQNLYEFLSRGRYPYVINPHQVSELQQDGNTALQRKVQRMFGSARGIVYVSRRNRDTLVNKWKIDRQVPEYFTHNPLNLSEAKAIPMPDTQVWNFATVAAINFEQKGHDRLLWVLGTEAWRERNWNWNIYGSGPDAEALANMIRELGLQDKVKLKGFQQDIRAVWQANHFHVLPTLSEGMPMAVVESLICGRPVMATDIGGMREWVEAGVNGSIATDPSEASIAAAMEQLWLNRETLAGQWEQISAKALQQYNFNYAQDLLQFITNSKP